MDEFLGTVGIDYDANKGKPFAGDNHGSPGKRKNLAESFLVAAAAIHPYSKFQIVPRHIRLFTSHLSFIHIYAV